MALGKNFFDELKKRCELNEKQILILKSLRNSDLTAKKISAKSKIPLGRLYDYINELLSYGLIEKKGKKPCFYSIDNIDEKIRNFMKSKFEKVLTDEVAVLSMLNGNEIKDSIEITKTKEEFTYVQLRMLSSCKKMYTFSRFGSMPLMIYPSKWEDFLKLRKAVSKVRPTLAHSSYEMSIMVTKAYIDAHKSGKRLIAVMCKETFDFHIALARKHFGEEFVQNMIDDLKQKIKNYHLEIYLLNEHIPMQLFMNEDTVYLSMVHEGATFGAVIHSKDVRDMYIAMYEGMIDRSIPIDKYIKGLLKN